MELTQNDTMPDAFSKHIRDRENADRPAGEEEQDTSEQDAAEPDIGEEDEDNAGDL